MLCPRQTGAQAHDRRTGARHALGQPLYSVLEADRRTTGAQHSELSRETRNERARDLGMCNRRGRNHNALVDALVYPELAGGSQVYPFCFLVV